MRTGTARAFSASRPGAQFRLDQQPALPFCYSKAKNVPAEKAGVFGYGDVWTWTAICADTKLVPSWYVGQHNVEDAEMFMRDLASRLSHRVQLTTGGHKLYLHAVESASVLTSTTRCSTRSTVRRPEGR